MTKHYLNDDGTRWYIKINNKSDEDKLYFPLLDIAYKFPYYVVFDEDIGEEEKYSTLKELKEGEDFVDKAVD